LLKIMGTLNYIDNILCREQSLYLIVMENATKIVDMVVEKYNFCQGILMSLRKKASNFDH